MPPDMAGTEPCPFLENHPSCSTEEDTPKVLRNKLVPQVSEGCHDMGVVVALFMSHVYRFKLVLLTWAHSMPLSMLGLCNAMWLTLSCDCHVTVMWLSCDCYNVTTIFLNLVPRPHPKNLERSLVTLTNWVAYYVTITCLTWSRASQLLLTMAIKSRWSCYGSTTGKSCEARVVA